jgi:pyrroloquinoline-quinone synthase
VGTAGFRRASSRGRSNGVFVVSGTAAGIVKSEELVERFHALGRTRYHDKHPFHQRLVAGELAPAQVRAWISNRYYYQKAIPVKDAYVLAALPSAEYRRVWIARIHDHDGTNETTGGTAMWLALARAAGLEEEEVRSERLVAPGTRFAVDAYVNFARTRSWVEAVASSLTELFGPPVMAHRVQAIVEQYPWIDRGGLAYFEHRIPLASRDAESALAWVLAEARTPEIQDRCLDALRFKCDVLWSILDATALQCGVFA